MKQEFTLYAWYCNDSGYFRVGPTSILVSEQEGSIEIEDMCFLNECRKVLLRTEVCLFKCVLNLICKGTQLQQTRL